MAGLRFTDLQSRPLEFLDFTSLTLAPEFTPGGRGQSHCLHIASFSLRTDAPVSRSPRMWTGAMAASVWWSIRTSRWGNGMLMPAADTASYTAAVRSLWTCLQ